MRRTTAIAVAGIILVGSILAGCQMFGRGDDPGDPAIVAGATEAASLAGAPALAEGPVVDARVVPARQAELGFVTGGMVAELLVAEGDFVEEGQVLARLDAAQQRTAVSRAQADLQRAQAAYDNLVAGARLQEIAEAEAALAAANARLARVAGGTLPGQIAAAEADVAGARAALRKVQEGASEEALISARAALANAEAALSQAQSAYDEVKWQPNISALPQSAALQQATNNFEAARAQLADLQNGPSQADLDGAYAAVEQTQARLDQLLAEQPEEVAAAEEEVRQLAAQLDLLRAGASPEEIAVAAADVAAATATLQQALVALADTELRAPFSGTVAVVSINAGEQATASIPILRMGDLADWEFRTEDLTELDIVNVQPGQQVQVAFDAIPDLTLLGTVDRIRPVGADQRGDIVYTVVVKPDVSDERLLWNMTAVVDFGGQ